MKVLHASHFLLYRALGPVKTVYRKFLSQTRLRGREYGKLIQKHMTFSTTDQEEGGTAPTILAAHGFSSSSPVILRREPRNTERKASPILT